MADQFNHRIQVFAPGGELLGLWGGPGKDDSRFDRPTDVAVADEGRIYVADFGNGRVQVFTFTDRPGAIRKEQTRWQRTGPSRSSLGRYWY